MSDENKVIGEAIETFLTGKVLKETAGKQIAGIDARCVDGFIKGACQIQGEISLLGKRFRPNFLKSKTYLGDGVFDLRIDLRTHDSACSKSSILQGIIDVFEKEFDIPVALGAAHIKVQVGPISFHFRIYECAAGALPKLRAEVASIPSVENPFALPNPDNNPANVAVTKGESHECGCV